MKLTSEINNYFEYNILIFSSLFGESVTESFIVQAKIDKNILPYDSVGIFRDSQLGSNCEVTGNFYNEFPSSIFLNSLQFCIHFFNDENMFYFIK